MNFFSNQKKYCKGTALFLSILILSFLITIALVITKMQMRELKFSVNEEFSARALGAADAGIERALYKLYVEDDLVLPSTTDSYISQQNLDNDSSYYVSVPRGNDDPVQVSTHTEYIILRSIGNFHQIERSLEVNLYKKLPAS
jgi:hypothetical protein